MLSKLKSLFDNTKASERVVVKISSPIEGLTAALTEVPDPAFAEEMLGRGIAIRPNTGHVVSPVNGKVDNMFDTKHAVSLVSDDGAEILIHIGIDTVKLKGEHFTSHAKSGDTVRVGDKLIDFDMAAIVSAGYDIITPVVICNTDAYKDFDLQVGVNVKRTDLIMELGV